MLTVTIPLIAAHAGFTATLPHASKDDVTPVICTVNVDDKGLVATDRFTLAVYDLLVRGDLDGGSIMVPREGAEWVSKLPLKKLRNAPMLESYSLRISQSDRDTEIALMFDDKVERSQSFDTVMGHFPAVRRLVESWKPSEAKGLSLSLDPKLTARILDYAAKVDGGSAVRFEVGHSEHPTKPGPLRFRVGGLLGMFQPNITL